MAPKEQDDQFADNPPPAQHDKIARPAVHIPTDEETETHVEELHGHDDWRSKTLHVLHSKPITFFLLGLLLLDVIILFAELYLGAEYPSCSTVVRDGISCCPAEGGGDAAAAANSGHRWLTEMEEMVAAKGYYRDAANKWDAVGSTGHDWSRALAEDAHADDADDHADETVFDHGDDADDHGDDHSGGTASASAMASAHGDGHHSYCTNGLTDMDPTKYPAACDEHKYAALHKAHSALFWMTVVILSIFLVELSLMIICLGCAFFTKPFYVLDLFVVSLSLAFELTFHYIDESSLASLAGLLILARLWRFVRIGHGLVESTNKWQGQKHERLLKYVDELEGLCKDNDIPLPDRQSIRNLKLLNDEEDDGH